MKITTLVLVTASMTMMWACSGTAGDSHDHEGEEHAHADAHAHEDEITLEPAMAQRMGVRVDTLRRQPIGQVLHVSGEIMPAAAGSAVVTAPTAGIVTLASGITAGASVSAGATIAHIKATGVSGGDANAAALAQLNAAKREMERLKPLYDERIVTAHEYNAAVAAYESARAAYSPSAASGRAAAPISGVVTEVNVSQGQYAEIGTPIATIASSAELTLRADVPQRYYGQLGAINDARVTLPYATEPLLLSTLGARRTSQAAAATSPGYVPVFFTFRNDGSLLPGTQVDVYLLAADSREALAVPRSALVEQQGSYFIFEQVDDHGYKQVAVTLGVDNGEMVEVSSPMLKGGEVIVVEGATTVRLAGAAGAMPEGHSHNH